MITELSCTVDNETKIYPFSENELEFIDKGSYSTVYKCKLISENIIKIVNCEHNNLFYSAITEISALKILSGIDNFPKVNNFYTSVCKKFIKISMSHSGIDIRQYSLGLSHIDRQNNFYDIMGQLIRGLYYLNTNNIFNTDIHIKNILIKKYNNNAHLTIIDFNICNFGTNYRYHTASNKILSVNKFKLFGGTHYMQAPENPFFVKNKTYSWYVGIIAIIFCDPMFNIFNVSKYLKYISRGSYNPYNDDNENNKLNSLKYFNQILHHFNFDNELKMCFLEYTNRTNINQLYIKYNSSSGTKIISNINNIVIIPVSSLDGNNALFNEMTKLNNWLTFAKRNILIDWIVEIIGSEKNKEVLIQFVYLCDQYILKHSINIDIYQLIGSCCLIIADIMMNCNNMSINTMIYYCADTYQKQEFDEMLIKILLSDINLWNNNIYDSILKQHSNNSNNSNNNDTVRDDNDSINFDDCVKYVKNNVFFNKI
jgi:serine/threonine protein kinase